MPNDHSHYNTVASSSRGGKGYEPRYPGSYSPTSAGSHPGIFNDQMSAESRIRQLEADLLKQKKENSALVAANQAAQAHADEMHEQMEQLRLDTQQKLRDGADLDLQRKLDKAQREIRDLKKENKKLAEELEEWRHSASSSKAHHHRRHSRHEEKQRAPTPPDTRQLQDEHLRERLNRTSKTTTLPYHSGPPPSSSKSSKVYKEPFGKAAPRRRNSVSIPNPYASSPGYMAPSVYPSESGDYVPYPVGR